MPDGGGDVKGRRNTRVLLGCGTGAGTGVDRERKHVMDGRNIAYDARVLVTGAAHAGAPQGQVWPSGIASLFHLHSYQNSP